MHTHRHTVKKKKTGKGNLREKWSILAYSPLGQGGHSRRQERHGGESKSVGHTASTLSRYTVNMKEGQDIKPQGPPLSAFPQLMKVPQLSQIASSPVGKQLSQIHESIRTFHIQTPTPFTSISTHTTLG